MPCIRPIARLPLRHRFCRIGSAMGPMLRRSYHETTAEFVTINTKGVPENRTVEISIGDPGESYIYVDPEVGHALKLGVVQQIGPGVTRGLNDEMFPLVFNHRSRHFTHKAVPFPRIVIDRDLPRQSPEDDSPATLWLSAKAHAITLDGTPDEEFERMSRETGSELAEAMKKLEGR